MKLAHTVLAAAFAALTAQAALAQHPAAPAPMI